MSLSRQPPVPSRGKEKKRLTANSAKSIARTVVDAFLDKKGTDILVMDLRGISGVADYFVISTGSSDTQIKALASAARELVKEKLGERPWHTEGFDHLQWVLLDYVDVVAHIFNEERRIFYDLERLWGDAPIESVPDDADAAALEILREDQ